MSVLINDLYYGHTCECCGGFENAARQGIKFSPEALAKGLEAIYKGLNVRDEIEDHIFRETLRLFLEAAAKGMSETMDFDLSDDFAQQIRTNTAVFSAFRTHRMQNDLAAQLLDSEGRLKPFRQWVKDVQGMTNHYVRNWMNTEYNTAVIRAHAAAEWKKFEKYSSVYPNLRWMPTTSPNQDPLHRQYWEAGLTLPINHPFWDEHRPGDRWNCKCRLRQTDDPANDTVIKDFYPVQQQPGLDNNPGKDGKLFNDTHPYFKSSCKICPFYGSKDKGLFRNAGKDCYACQGLSEAIDRVPKSIGAQVYVERKRLLEDDNIPFFDKPKELVNIHTGKILLKHKPLKRLLNHCRSMDDLSAAI